MTFGTLSFISTKYACRWLQVLVVCIAISVKGATAAHAHSTSHAATTSKAPAKSTFAAAAAAAESKATTTANASVGGSNGTGVIATSAVFTTLVSNNGTSAIATTAVFATPNSSLLNSTNGSQTSNAGGVVVPPVGVSTSSNGTTSLETTSLIAIGTTVGNPSSTLSPYEVIFQVTLPLTLSQFDATAQQKFRQSIAAAAGLPAANYSQVFISFSGTRRRLLAGIAINVTVNVASAADANAAVSSLTPASINNQLAANGLPAATVVTMPRAAVFKSSASTSQALHALIITAQLIVITYITSLR